MHIYLTLSNAIGRDNRSIVPCVAIPVTVLTVPLLLLLPPPKVEEDVDECDNCVVMIVGADVMMAGTICLPCCSIVLVVCLLV